MVPFPIPADQFMLGFVTDCIPATDVDNLMGPFTDPVQFDLFCNAWNVVAKFQESFAKYSHLLPIVIHRLVMTMSWVTLQFYHLQGSWGKVMFLQVCVILFTGGEYLGRYTPWARYTPPDQVQPPGTREIRFTRGQYTSYWNAFLFQWSTPTHIPKKLS